MPACSRPIRKGLLWTQRTNRTSRCCKSVRTADLDKVYAAAAKVLANEKPTSWKLKAFKYYYIPDPPIGIAGIVIEPTEDLTRLQQELLDAIAPFTVKTGTAAAFMTTEEGRDIQGGLIDYVTNFVSIGAGKKFNPHVTTGVGTIVYLDKMLAEPFGVHVLACISIGLSTWHFWYGPQGTQGFGVAAVRPFLRGECLLSVEFVEKVGSKSKFIEPSG